MIWVLDGARFPLKAAEHARRNEASTRQAALDAAHAAGDSASANEFYPADNLVYDWPWPCRTRSAAGSSCTRRPIQAVQLAGWRLRLQARAAA